MRLTKQTNYAVRMLMYCAANDGKLSRVPEIAKAYGVSELFLFKIIQPLHKAGIMDTVRGRNGGVRLGRPAADITLFDVVRVTEENFAMAECFEVGAETDCPLVDSCGFNSALREALNAFFAATHRDLTVWGVASICSSILFLLAYAWLPRVRKTPGWHFFYSSLCDICVAMTSVKLLKKSGRAASTSEMSSFTYEPDTCSLSSRRSAVTHSARFLPRHAADAQRHGHAALAAFIDKLLVAENLRTAEKDE